MEQDRSDQYAVAVKKDGIVPGQLLRKALQICSLLGEGERKKEHTVYGRRNS